MTCHARERHNLTNAGDNLPGGVIFNCLSHDVVAHETTHALLEQFQGSYTQGVVS
ncbi:hypothetical protein [Edaphobacter aggregans]|uniref:hypothetical protein n=1 Tax=Edaphobacter aggregans TaxID=570835 RepID=UPI0012F89CF5|nr:hypothetical protein [Edaphobacter aggregans]